MMTMKASDYRIFLDGYYADLYADGSDNNRNYHCTHAIINYLDRMDSGGQSWECLDIGFGRGTLLQYFVERSWTATGVEIAQSSYQTQFIEVAGIETSFCGYQEFETSKSFDLVVDNGTFHHQHPDERASYLGKIADQMTANGKFLLTTYFTHKHDADCTEVLEDGRFRFSLNTKSLSDMFVKHCPRLFVEQETRIVRTERDQDCVLFVIRKHGAQK